MSDTERIIKKLNLKPHPKEGGFFSETYRAREILGENAIPDGYEGDRNISTCIYYMLTPETFSEMHILKSDEIFHFYLGDPVEMLHLYPDGSGKRVIFGRDILHDMEAQIIVPRNVWQGARLVEGGKFALMGTTVAPGFDYSDYRTGNRNDLISSYPDFSDMIIKLTR